MRTRALVARPGRKTHFASIGLGETVYLAVCDREVPVFGATITGRDDWTTWLAAAEHDDGSMCRLCRTPLLVAALALAEVDDVRAAVADVAALEAEVRTLRAEVSRWTTAALGEGKARLRRLAARREARIDARLTEAERIAR